MRGCLFVLVVAAAMLAAVAWFGSPILASAAVAAALQNAGYHAVSSTVTTTADPPPKLLLGRADRIEIAGADIDFRTFHAASLDLVLTDADIVARTAVRISGRITGAELTTADGDSTSADVDIAGVANAANATIVVDAATVDRIVKATFQRRLGVTVSTTELAAPDTIRISAGGSTVEGRVLVDASGAIAFSTSLGSSPIISIDPSFPLRLRTAGVEAGDLRIDATLDVNALLGG